MNETASKHPRATVSPRSRCLLMLPLLLVVTTSCTSMRPADAPMPSTVARATPAAARAVEAESDSVARPHAWHLEIDRAPCVGEEMTLRSTLDPAAVATLSTNEGDGPLRGELWLRFPGEALMARRASPPPTRVEGHGRPGGEHAVVWENLELSASATDSREAVFLARSQTVDVTAINLELVASGVEAEATPITAPTLHLQIGGPDVAPFAVADLTEVDRSVASRCADADAQNAP